MFSSLEPLFPQVKPLLMLADTAEPVRPAVLLDEKTNSCIGAGFEAQMAEEARRC